MLRLLLGPEILEEPESASTMGPKLEFPTEDGLTSRSKRSSCLRAEETVTAKAMTGSYTTLSARNFANSLLIFEGIPPNYTEKLHNRATKHHWRDFENPVELVPRDCRLLSLVEMTSVS